MARRPISVKFRWFVDEVCEMSEFYDLPTIVSVCNRWATSIDTNDFVKLRHDSDVMIKLLDELQAVYWAFKYDALEVLVENLDSHF